MGNALAGDVRQCKNGTRRKRRKDTRERKWTTSKDGHGEYSMKERPKTQSGENRSMGRKVGKNLVIWGCQPTVSRCLSATRSLDVNKRACIGHIDLKRRLVKNR